MATPTATPQVTPLKTLSGPSAQAYLAQVGARMTSNVNGIALYKTATGVTLQVYRLPTGMYQVNTVADSCVC